MTETGLAFSGGGIRSAAYCSGVLRRLLQRNTKIDYLSCVSGGGYTGTAYLDWKFRNAKKDDPKWHQEFFDHMRERSGLMCDWQRPFKGILDTLVLVSLMLLVSVIMPIIVWGSYLFPLVYGVDFAFGGLLRAVDECDPTQGNYTVRRAPTNNSAPPMGKRRGPRCKLEAGSPAYERIIMFAVLGTLFVFFYFLAKKWPRFRYNLNFLSVVSGLILAFTSIPYFIYFFFDRTPFWAQLLIFFFSIAVWLFFPVLRRKSSFVVVVYVYSYAVYWKVYETSVFGLDYSDELFYRLLFGCGFALWIVPALGALQQRLVYIFNRWRLQLAFYTDASVGASGCTGIGCEDIFLVTCKSSTDHQTLGDTESGPLTLGDLDGLKPEYLSNIVVNEWSQDESDHKRYELLIMSPKEIERLDHRSDEEQFRHRLNPEDIDLSAAMATSAAAVARNMGAYDRTAEGFKQLQVVLGLGMGSSMVSDVEALKRENCLWRTLPYLIEMFRVLPLVTFPLIYFVRGEKADDEKWVAIGVLLFFIMLLILIVISTLKTGSATPGCLEKLTRWFVVHVPFVRYMRQIMNVSNHGPSPPPILRLSDGGHMENLAILPLLKKRLSKIVVADGGYKIADDEWGKSLLSAMSLAREKLHCSFIGMNGRDAIEYIREQFVDTPPGHQPRTYRCKVQYYERNSIFEPGTKVGEGEILLLAPRHPNKGIKKQERVTWKEALRDIDVDLEAGKWGVGPQLDAEEVDSLTFCCCECCHGSSLRGLSNAMCGVFPEHITANQFFTPRMFRAYHSEGYNACMEAEAAEFLGAVHEVEMTSSGDYRSGV